MSAPPTAATSAASAVSDDSALVRQSILKLKPYVPGKPIEEVKRELGLPADFEIIKLASNENVLGPSARAVEAMNRAATGVWLYPDDTCYELKNALSDFWNLGADHFILGNGSDEVIHFLGQAFLDGARGDEVIFGDPSFVQYKSCALMADCAFHAVPLTPDYRHDLVAMKTRVNENTRLIFIANSNNPTGTVVTRAEFEILLDGLPKHVVVVLDEAYFQYIEAETDSPRAMDYIADHNVIGMHTFSKAYALAGLRVGYGFGNPKLIRFLAQVRGPFNVNMLAQAAAVAALGDAQHLEDSIRVNAAGRDQLCAAFAEMKLEYISSQANFVLVNIGVDSQSVFNDLLRAGVIVRTGTPFGMLNWVRVTVGTKAMNETFVAALKKIL